MSGDPQYLMLLPKPGEVPAGKVVVHNHVRPTRRLGQRGFRAWLLRAASLPATSPGIWAAERDGVSVTAIETYPAVARKSAPLASRCAEMLRTTPFASSSGGVIPDVEDALVCALVAHLFSDVPGGVEPVPPTAPEIEGWIILPRGLA